MNLEKAIRLPSEKNRLSLALLLLGLVAVGGVAEADESGNLQERLLACEGMVSQEKKLECFNAVVDGLDRGKPQAAQPDKPKQPPAVAPAAATVPKSTSIPVEQAPVAEAVKPESDSDYGLKVKKDKKPKEAAVMATIVRVWMNHDQRFSVELDNGQQWRETQGTRVGKPKEGASVAISSGSFGSYRMKIDGISRKAWVRRTK